MPFDFKKYDEKCNGLTPEELQREWQHYTRLISGASTSTAISGLAVPLTAGVSTIGVAMAAPAIHNARKKRDIIQKHLDKHAVDHVTRKRDVLGSMAFSGTVGVVTLGVGTLGTDALASAGAEHGISAIVENDTAIKIVSHAALDGAGMMLEHKHTSHVKKKEAHKAFAAAGTFQAVADAKAQEAGYDVNGQPLGASAYVVGGSTYVVGESSAMGAQSQPPPQYSYVDQNSGLPPPPAYNVTSGQGSTQGYQLGPNGYPLEKQSEYSIPGSLGPSYLAAQSVPVSQPVTPDQTGQAPVAYGQPQQYQNEAPGDQFAGTPQPTQVPDQYATQTVAADPTGQAAPSHAQPQQYQNVAPADHFAGTPQPNAGGEHHQQAAAVVTHPVLTPDQTGQSSNHQTQTTQPVQQFQNAPPGDHFAPSPAAPQTNYSPSINSSVYNMSKLVETLPATTVTSQPATTPKPGAQPPPTRAMGAIPTALPASNFEPAQSQTSPSPPPGPQELPAVFPLQPQTMPREQQVASAACESAPSQNANTPPPQRTTPPPASHQPTAYNSAPAAQQQDHSSPTPAPDRRFSTQAAQPGQQPLVTESIVQYLPQQTPPPAQQAAPRADQTYFAHAAPLVVDHQQQYTPVSAQGYNVYSPPQQPISAHRQSISVPPEQVVGYPPPIQEHAAVAQHNWAPQQNQQPPSAHQNYQTYTPPVAHQPTPQEQAQLPYTAPTPVQSINNYTAPVAQTPGPYEQQYVSAASTPAQPYTGYATPSYQQPTVETAPPTPAPPPIPQYDPSAGHAYATGAPGVSTQPLYAPAPVRPQVVSETPAPQQQYFSPPPVQAQQQMPYTQQPHQYSDAASARRMSYMSTPQQQTPVSVAASTASQQQSYFPPQSHTGHHYRQSISGPPVNAPPTPANLPYTPPEPQFTPGVISPQYNGASQSPAFQYQAQVPYQSTGAAAYGVQEQQQKYQYQPSIQQTPLSPPYTPAPSTHSTGPGYQATTTTYFPNQMPNQMPNQTPYQYQQQ